MPTTREAVVAKKRKRSVAGNADDPAHESPPQMHMNSDGSCPTQARFSPTRMTCSQMKCPKGHPLQRFRTRPSLPASCDTCDPGGNTPAPVGTILYGCQQCDWDICEQCSRPGAPPDEDPWTHGLPHPPDPQWYVPPDFAASWFYRMVAEIGYPLSLRNCSAVHGATLWRERYANLPPSRAAEPCVGTYAAAFEYCSPSNSMHLTLGRVPTRLREIRTYQPRWRRTRPPQSNDESRICHTDSDMRQQSQIIEPTNPLSPVGWQLIHDYDVRIYNSDDCSDNCPQGHTNLDHHAGGAHVLYGSRSGYFPPSWATKVHDLLATPFDTVRVDNPKFDAVLERSHDQGYMTFPRKPHLEASLRCVAPECPTSETAKRLPRIHLGGPYPMIPW